jgi:hypothetical protein
MQLADGLATLHHAGKVHRDVKPSNVLVTRSGHLSLLDFGVVKDQASMLWEEDTLVGTASYMAPEQARGPDVAPSADLYSVGTMLYEALTGKRPFIGAASAVMQRKQTNDPTWPKGPARPSDLEALAIELLSRDPECRPDAAQVKARIERRDGSSTRSGARRRTGVDSSEAEPFLGREAELEALLRAFATTRRKDTPVLVFVRGESGIGKSARLTALARRATSERPDTLVLSGRCYEREQVPYKALDGAIDHLAQGLTRLPDEEAAALLPIEPWALARVFPVLGQVQAFNRAAAAVREDVDPHELRRLAFTGLKTTLVKLTERRPVLLLLDDLQWADSDSWLLLADLLAPPSPPPMCVVAALRPEGEVPERLPIAAQTLELGPLGLDAAVELATQTLGGRRTGTDVAAKLAAEAKGHPLFVVELSRFVASGAGQTTADDERRTLRLEDAMSRRMTELPAEAISVLQLVCLAGVPLAEGIFFAASQLDRASFSRAIAKLRADRLVKTSGGRVDDPIEPYHDRVRETVVGLLGATAPQSWHERLARALLAAGYETERPELLVEHLEGAGEAGPAAQTAKRAARRAARAAAFDRAAELYATALRLGVFAPDERHKLQVSHGDALALAGRGIEAADAYLGAVEGEAVDPAEARSLRTRALRQLLTTGYLERGRALAKELCHEAQIRFLESDKAIFASVLWHRGALRLRGPRFQERDPASLDAHQVETIDLLAAMADGFAIVEPLRGAEFRARALARALSTGEPRRIARQLAAYGVHIVAAGAKNLTRGRVLLRQAEELAKRLGDPGLIAFTRFATGMASYFGGEFFAAAETLDEADHAFIERGIGAGWELDSARLFRLYALNYLGEARQAQRLAQEHIADAARRRDRFSETSLRRAAAWPVLCCDGPAAARALLEGSVWTSGSGKMDVQEYYDARSRAYLALYEGRDPSELAALVPRLRAAERSLISRVQTIRAGAWVAHARLLLAAARPGAARRNELLADTARIAKQLLSERVGHAEAHGHIVRAGIAGVQGDSNHAAAHLRAAIATAERVGMAPEAACGRRRLAALVGGAEGTRLLAESDFYMASQKIFDADRMTACLVPGFSA